MIEFILVLCMIVAGIALADLTFLLDRPIPPYPKDPEPDDE